MGLVRRPHGLRGELRVQAFAQGAPNLRAGKRVLAGDVVLTIRASREDRDAWIVGVEGVGSRTQAEAFRGYLLEMADAELEREDAESYFHHELIGLRALTPGGRELGTLTEVLSTGANDVYVVKGEAGELLFPAIAEVVERVDVASGIIVMTPLEGMLDESE